MRKLLICMFLCAVVLLVSSCQGVIREGVEYRVTYRHLNQDGTYDYELDDQLFFYSGDEMEKKDRLKIGDKFTISINKIKEK